MLLAGVLTTGAMTVSALRRPSPEQVAAAEAERELGK
jgi:hypothetical protein